MQRLSMSFTALLVFVLAALAFTQSTAHARERLALIIGNSEYKGTGKLKNPVNDARLIAETLTALKFKVFKHENLDWKATRDAVLDFSSEVSNANGDAIALIYYAGHGYQRDGKSYIVPVDARIKKPQDIKKAGIDVNFILDEMEEGRAKTNILILDACRNNPFPSDTRGSRGLARIESPSGTLVAYSTEPGEVAEDGDGDNSTYSLALAKHLKTPNIVIQTVFTRVRLEVHEATSGSQLPKEDVSLTEEVYLGGKQAVLTPPDDPTPPINPGSLCDNAKADAIKKNTAKGYREFIRICPKHEWAAQATRLANHRDDEELWLEVKSIDTVSAYRRYTLAFPNGSHKSEAEDSIREIERDRRSDKSAWSAALTCMDNSKRIADQCRQLRTQIECIEGYRQSQNNSGRNDEDALEALEELRGDLEGCKVVATPEPEPQPAPEPEPTLDGQYVGTRGYNRSRGRHCRRSYPQFTATISNGRINFYSDGRTWTGSVNPNGEIYIDRGGISGTLRTHMYVRGNISNATMDSGFCGLGWFRLAKIPESGGNSSPPPPSAALGSGTYQAFRGYTNPRRPKPYSECLGRNGPFKVEVTGSQIEFWLDGRLLRGSITPDGTISINGNNSLVRGRRFKSRFWIRGHYSNARMLSGYCMSGYFQIKG